MVHQKRPHACLSQSPAVIVYMEGIEKFSVNRRTFIIIIRVKVVLSAAAEAF